MVKCIKEMYDWVTFCVKCGEDEVTNFIERKEEQDKAVIRLRISLIFSQMML
jgi:hypothetical protein